MNINSAITALVEYGLCHEWFSTTDRCLMLNRILELLRLDGFISVDDEELFVIKEQIKQPGYLPVLLGKITDFAVTSGLVEEDTIGRRDLFDTKLMGLLLPLPAQINREFWREYQHGPRIATDLFYQFCQNANYIRMDRMVLDQHWLSSSSYGELEITVNLSKPEKDPRDIAALKDNPSTTGYPQCLLCPQNEGYAGNLNHPARQNLRLISLDLCNEVWFLQYSPYTYYNEHCIVLSAQHRPMKINRETFEYLFTFLKILPHYFIGSNADLPIVGGSILNHDHFQGGRHQFLIENTTENLVESLSLWPEIKLFSLEWPLTTLRLRGQDVAALVAVSTHILSVWREYSYHLCDILAYTDSTPHNTITPIARRRGKEYEIDLVLRNNRTTPDHPLGIFHPHSEHHHIKKENIGLIEVMGLAVLPGRLLSEIQQIKGAIFSANPDDALQHPDIIKHYDWLKTLQKEEPLTQSNFTQRIQAAIGKKFSLVLEDCGVFKNDSKGYAGLRDFLAKAEAACTLQTVKG